MTVLKFQSIRKFIKDITIMLALLIMIYLILNFFGGTSDVVWNIICTCFFVYGFFDVTIIKFELKHNEYNDTPDITEFPIITMFILLLIGYLCIQILKVIYLTFEAYIVPFFQVISSLDAVIIVAIITGFATIVTQLISKYIEGKNSRKQYLSEKREYAYQKMVDMVYKMKGKKYSQKEMIDDLTKFSKEITLWGSKALVTKWATFRKISINGSSGCEALMALEDVLNQLRKDMGVGRSKKKELLAFFINDIENLK